MSTDTTVYPHERQEAALFLRDVEMKFGSIRALRELTFTVPRRSLCGLVGPNGAGKTTTMRILVTDLESSEGVVEVLGHRLPAQADRIRSRIGYMPDGGGLYEELTLGEYLEFFAAFYGFARSRRREAVEAVTDLVGVRGLAGRRLSGLSKGERQRVLLARALIHDPDLLILDEPGDGLDPRGRVELRELLTLLHERGKTILISSHILADLEEICTDLVLVDQGRVRFCGSRAQLFASGLKRCRIRIECLDSPRRLLEHLAGVPGIAFDESQDGGIEVDAPPEPSFAHGLLQDLLARGVKVTSFARSTDTLESIYLRLTEKGAPG